MYKTKLEEDEDGGEETNIDVHASGGEVHRITLDYGISNGDVTEEHNIILETPASKDTLNKSGNERLYQLEEEPTYTTYKKRKKEEKKAKKKKDKEAKKLTKENAKKTEDEIEIIFTNEALNEEDGNNFPTLAMPSKSDTNETGAKPYFMATSDQIVLTNYEQKEDELDAIIPEPEPIKRQGKHRIPRLVRSNKKEDENHLIYRREDEKEDGGGTSESSEDLKVWPSVPQRYPSPDRYYQEPRSSRLYSNNMPRPPMPLPPNAQIQYSTINRDGRIDPVGDPNYFYASVATMQRDRAKAGLQTRGEIDGHKFHENPYHVMPSNRNANRIDVLERGVPRPAGLQSNVIHPPPPPPPSTLYGGPYAYNPYSTKAKSNAAKKSGPPTWKEVRDVYLKSQQPEEDRWRKFSPNRHLEGLALAIGFIGMLLAISLLLAYVIVQAPQLRRKIGPSYYISPGEELDPGANGGISLSDNREDRGLDAPKDDAGNPADEVENNDARGIKPSSKRHYVIYGLEIGLSIVVGIMMITTNALLIHGVRKKYGQFLLPWLVFHAFLIIALFAAVVLILVLVEFDPYKGFSVLPGVTALLLVLCWIKIYKLRVNFVRQQKRKCGKMEDIYGVASASTYAAYGDNTNGISPKMPDPDYSMG